MSIFPQHRHHEIKRIRGDLERDSFPRLQMFLLVTLTGASGFVASYILLHAGFVEMWLRYLASLGVAYLIFLALLWLWLRTRAEDYADLPDVSGVIPSGSDESGACYGGNGGDFGGAGASGSFDAPSEDISMIGDSSGSVGDALGTVAEAEEFAIPLVVLVLSARWLSRPSSWSIRLRRSLRNSWWTVCYPQASIAGFAALKRVTGWKRLFAARLCPSSSPL